MPIGPDALAATAASAAAATTKTPRTASIIDCTSDRGRHAGRRLRGTSQTVSIATWVASHSAESRPQRQGEPDRDRDARALDRADLPARICVPMTGNCDSADLTSRSCRSGLSLQHDARDRGQHHEQREEREEAVVGDRGGERSGPALAEALRDSRREGEPAMRALVAIEPPEGERSGPCVRGSHGDVLETSLRRTVISARMSLFPDGVESGTVWPTANGSGETAV